MRDAKRENPAADTSIEALRQRVAELEARNAQLREQQERLRAG